jgi:hypothetical protein
MPLIIKGAPLEIGIPVNDFLQFPTMETKLWHGARPRRELVTLIVLHWTGGEGSAQQIKNVLDSRKLGAEFIGDREGQYWQCCDPCFLDALNAGRFNPRKLGIEIANYGTVWPSNRKPPSKGRDRPVSGQIIHGRLRRNVAAFYPIQITNLLVLLDALLEAFPDVPRAIPLDENGELIRGKLSRKEANSFRGICGHFHLSGRKIDPGVDLMLEVGKHLGIGGNSDG